MLRLIQFFYQYRELSLFLLLEIICFWMIVSFNVYQTSSYFNSSNYLAGQINSAQSSVVDYFRLGTINQQLAEENKQLRQLLTREQQRQSLLSEIKLDSSRLTQYNYVSAKVINNSINKFSSNYFTIDRGSNHGIKPGMGVLSIGGGVAGKVRSCTRNFALVGSLLNEGDFPAKIKRGNIDGIMKWDGPDPTEADLLHIGKHHKVYVGDTIITPGGYNTSFPEGMMIGKIKSVVDDGKKYIIKVRLTTDFTAMSYVYAVEDQLRSERDTLESKMKER